MRELIEMLDNPNMKGEGREKEGKPETHLEICQNGSRA
jgi:hypothetical protein